ncbi:dihydropteroate synthase [Ruminiclostridium herbifermentans]|uniref:Dihydropteroate synthase n=1 Tax=Ruminiclostridium herbifermentans TaxID=2488810 RepID=A0A4U7JN49_9FIRM|nr:dihydropteroate synthase [Ruminiclostridium herbifermentans]QNU68631.1 dihydropteroate synthase [Ruminiclostridium herbifermentans]
MTVKHKGFINIGKNVWEWGKRTYIMGILNVTPDSFSDGGKFNNEKTALKQAIRMVDEGADIIDVGGESTRPGSTVISEQEEIERVIPIIQLLSKELNIPISVDTYRAKTAEAAINAGAHMINDVWGLKYDDQMASVAAKYNVPVCIMHNRTTGTEYHNLIEDMLIELTQSIELAHKAGIKDENIIIDPGIGFAKTFEQNLEVMRQLDAFKRLGYPILLGASRKSFIGKILDLEVNDRLEGTLAITAAGIIKGCDIVRVHDIKENVRVSKIIDCLERKS